MSNVLVRSGRLVRSRQIRPVDRAALLRGSILACQRLVPVPDQVRCKQQGLCGMATGDGAVLPAVQPYDLPFGRGRRYSGIGASVVSGNGIYRTDVAVGRLFGGKGRMLKSVAGRQRVSQVQRPSLLWPDVFRLFVRSRCCVGFLGDTPRQLVDHCVGLQRVSGLQQQGLLARVRENHSETHVLLVYSQEFFMTLVFGEAAISWNVMVKVLKMQGLWTCKFSLQEIACL